jgi:hypothetical protein
LADFSGILINFLKNYLNEKGVKSNDETSYDDNAFYDKKISDKLFNEVIKLKNKSLFTELGQNYCTNLLEKNLIEKEDDIKNAILSMHKIYSLSVSGENTGIWKTVSIEDGFAAIEENSVFDDLFTKGILQGILKSHNCVGPIVKQTKSRDDDNYFNRFELTWMKRIK